MSKIIKYGVKLTYYRTQEFNAWVYENDRFETTDHVEALNKCDEYTARNPDGIYVVEEIPND